MPDPLFRKRMLKSCSKYWAYLAPKVLGIPGPKMYFFGGGGCGIHLFGQIFSIFACGVFQLYHSHHTRVETMKHLQLFAFVSVPFSRRLPL